MESITLLIKPVSGLCNLSCKYCFYEDVTRHRAVKSMGRMSEATAERLISQAFRTVSPKGMISFLFQGGEPTLAGLDFFRNFVALEKKYARHDVHIQHSIQTNGLLLNEEWAIFLQEHDFLVGLSLDGTQALHDKFRVHADGSGTWQQAVKALHLLERHRIETNLLCVVTEQTAKAPKEVYRCLTALGRHPLQFIPCLDPLECEHGSMPFSLLPDTYRDFLCTLFDCWYADWKRGKYVSIRSFDDYLRHLLRMPPSSCAASGSCGHYLVVEGNGNLYPCDFYVLDEWFLGNVMDISLEQALSTEASLRFVTEGSKRPAECKHCRYAPICRGGCKRDFTRQGSHYYCSALQTFFPYAIGRLEEMAAAYYYQMR